MADRWTLESFLSRSGVLQASIPDVTYFLGKTLTLSKKNIQLTIVGICDSEEPSVYVDPFALISFGSAGTEVMSLSQLKALYPGQYDDIILGDGEALTGPSAGIRQKVGSVYNINNHRGYRIAGLVEEDIYARLVVNDSQYEVLLKEMISSVRSFRLYTSDKETAKRLLTELPDDLVGVIQVKVTDHYTDYMNSYRAAAAKRVNARVIITLTIMGIAAVMLFLLLKARVDERREMLGVYRLLGIPNRRTLSIFAMESVCLSLVSGLPAALLTWGVIKALTVMPSLSFAMILPLRAALIAYAAAFLLHMALSLLPAVRLLCLPPAVLAAKFDF